MATTPQDLARTLMAEARARLASNAAKATALRQALDAALPKLVPSTCRVWLIGSLAQGTWEEGSDVDVVIEGLPPTMHSELWNALVDVLGLEPDVLRLEELDAEFQQRVLREGVILNVT